MPSSSLLLRPSSMSRPFVLYDLSLFSLAPFEAILPRRYPTLAPYFKTTSSVFVYTFSARFRNLQSKMQQSVSSWLQSSKGAYVQQDWVQACVEWIEQEEVATEGLILRYSSWHMWHSSALTYRSQTVPWWVNVHVCQICHKLHFCIHIETLVL